MASPIASRPSDGVTVVPWLYWSLLPIHRILLSLYFSEIAIAGAEHLPVTGPAVLAPKHYSRWDPIVLALLSLEPLWFMTKTDQFSGVQGWFLPRLGAFPVDVDHPRASSFRTAIRLLQSEKKLVVFPEGGIVRNQPLRPLKPGLARLVLQAEALSGSTRSSSLSGAIALPIVPIALRYKPDANFRSRIAIHISPPLYSVNYQQGNDRETAEALTQALQHSLLQGLEQCAQRLNYPQSIGA